LSGRALFSPQKIYTDEEIKQRKRDYYKNNQYLLFRGDTKHYFPNKTYDEGRTQREITNSFTGALRHKTARLKKIKSKASYINPNNWQFPIYRGTDNPDVDDGTTGELEGVFEGKPVLLSRFESLLAKGILDNMINKMDISTPLSALPALTFPE